MNKKWRIAAGLVIAALIGFYLYQKYRVAPAINLKTLNLVNIKEEPVDFYELFKGKKVVLCFSASWCGNCREEMETINSIKEKELSDVEVVIISDEPIEKVRTFSTHKSYPYTYLKMKQSFGDIGINSIPTVYLLNRNLEIKKETVGYLNWKDPSTLNYLKGLME